MQIHIVYCGKDAQIQRVFGMQPFSKTSAFVALAAGNHAVAAAVSVAELEKQEKVIVTIKKFLSMIVEKIKSALAAKKPVDKLKEQKDTASMHLKEAEKKFGDMKEFAARIKKKLAEMHEHIMKAEEKHADKKQIRQLKAKYNDQYRDFYGKDYYTLEPDHA